MMTSPETLAVCAGGAVSGLLAREGGHRHVFAYSPEVSDDQSVSLTMPVRLESWTSRDLHPIFQMNLPEGALLEAIRRAIAKIIGDDDLSILRVTGGNQVGRNRFYVTGAEISGASESSESLEELLTFPDTRELFHELVKRYALKSGISGVQPKVMLDASARGTLASIGYIVKSWGADYPQLAANEFFCMTAAKKAGLPVPEFYLSDNGGLFIMRRFDLSEEGAPIGFEDMCSLQALGTAQKYGSTYERVARSLKDFVSANHLQTGREQFFAMLVLSSMLKNGDAHLKNFGVLYPHPGGKVSMAPVYDVISTTAYIVHDVPALSLAGTKKWWPRSMLEHFAVSHLMLPVGVIKGIFERLSTAVLEVRGTIPGYLSDNPEFSEVGKRMIDIWKEGVDALRK